MKRKLNVCALLALATFSLTGLGFTNVEESTKAAAALDEVTEEDETKITSLELTGPKTIKEGESAQLNIKFSNFKNGRLSWRSTNENVLSVDQKGEVTALDAGKATIEVTNTSEFEGESISDSLEIEVIGKEQQVFSVQYVDFDGTLLYETQVKLGEDAPFVGQEPKRSADHNFAYIFSGWDKEATDVNSNLVLTAQYETRDISDYVFVRNSGENSYRLYYYLGEEEEITIPEVYNGLPVTAIDSLAFQQATIKKVTLSNSIGVINDRAFRSLATLEEIVIPDSVYDFGTEVFEGCENLKKVTLPSTLKEIPESTFADCPKLTEVVFSDRVARIGESAFEGCTSLTSITLPDRVSAIGKNAFKESGLTSFTLPAECEEIGESAFQDCLSLSEFTWNKVATTISRNCFNGCTLLKSFVFETQVNTIDYGAFQESGLVTLDVPSTVTTFGAMPFRDCLNLETVKLMANVQSVPRSCFYGCEKLASITLSDTITSFETNAFQYCAISSLVGIISEKITSISNYCFAGTNLSGEIVLPGHIKTIGNSAFWQCHSLESVIMEEGITSIGNSCFEKCESLSKVSIPASLTKIGDSAFGETNIESYTVASGNSLYSSIDGNLLNSDGSILLQYAFGNTATSYKLPDSVLELSSGSFAGASNLKSIDLNVVQKINSEVFTNSSIESLVIPESLLANGLSSSAFVEMLNLKEVTFNATNVVDLPQSLFYQDTSLEKVVFNNDVETIASYVFSGCTGLKEITLPSSLRTIAQNAFLGTEVFTINYGGTKSQWNSITKTGANFAKGTKIVCTDGEVIM